MNTPPGSVLPEWNLTTANEMSDNNSIQIIDLFAGPGGLSEGFNSSDLGFKNIVSAEMDSAAHSTLRLRAFYRALIRDNPSSLPDYYAFCNGLTDQPWSPKSEKQWNEASKEAQQLTLGEPESNKILDGIIESEIDHNKPLVLIGGPPCQAYSLVGRARNMGIRDYSAKEDHRHFLYKEYLRVIQKYSPSVFVMENVKGILSSKVEGVPVFHEILKDLSAPYKALNNTSKGENYVICSLATGAAYHHGQCPDEFDSRQFILRSEDYGVPQKRHRVILLGIKESLFKTFKPLSTKQDISTFEAINDMPRLRSRFSKRPDNGDDWEASVNQEMVELVEEIYADASTPKSIASVLTSAAKAIDGKTSTGGLRVTKGTHKQASQYAKSLSDTKLNVVLNHEARGHMQSDLRRYAYASAYTEALGYSPKGAKEFNLPGLRPNHKNWETGKFADRFRVQAKGIPATTVTSHISKDGHYFIHYDPSQCRSWTVREAARIQSFPDNYFFMGNRTQQFHQVGNAVPPILAKQIANVVHSLLC